MDTLVSPSIAQPDFAASPLLADMLEDMADAIPVRETDTPERIARRHQAARAMVMSLHPADAIEAAMAISATVAYYASLSLRILAAHPRTTPREAAAIGRTAMASQRAFNAAVRDLHKRHAPAEPSRPRTTRAPQQPLAAAEQHVTVPVPGKKGAAPMAAVVRKPLSAAVSVAREETAAPPAELVAAQ